LLKTQNTAEGNFPDGTRSVGVNSLVMISSCMYPQVKYDTCKLTKQRANLNACLKNSGLDEKCVAKKESMAWEEVPLLTEFDESSDRLDTGTASSSLSRSSGFI
jgi:hypothetical protein